MTVDPAVLTFLEKRIRTLSREVWEDSVQWPDVERWLSNFTGETCDPEEEKLHALHLLANFGYFGLREVRELLHAIYRDLFRYPIIQKARTENGNSRDQKVLQAAFLEDLRATRFLGMGNPSESGAHLLYYFRQVNRLGRDLFIHQHEILDRAPGDPTSQLAIDGLRRLVFIDDLMGSGTQAAEYSTKLLSHVRAAAARSGTELEICYFTMFARKPALDVVRSLSFDRVEAVHEIDETERVFDSDSRVYVKPPPGVDSEVAKHMAVHYGRKLVPLHPLGYKNGQMLLGFHHNVPDNTLPIFWGRDMDRVWEPPFPRYGKG